MSKLSFDSIFNARPSVIPSFLATTAVMCSIVVLAGCTPVEHTQQQPPLPAPSTSTSHITTEMDFSSSSISTTTHVFPGSVSLEVRYFTPEGDQLGRGPLPPRVAETTRYMLILRITPFGSSTVPVFFSINLAENAVFTQKFHHTTIPEPRLSTTLRSLTWVGDIPTQRTSTWYMEVALTPSTTDQGRYARIIENGSLRFLDPQTHSEAVTPLPQRTTRLPDTDRGALFGAVVAKEYSD